MSRFASQSGRFALAARGPSTRGSNPSLSNNRQPRRAPVARAATDPAPEDASEKVVKGLALVAAPAAAFAVSSLVIDSHVLVDPLTGYLNAVGIPVINALSPPEWIVHWFHALNMGTVLFAMGGYGTVLGWKIRAGEGNEETMGPQADTVRELHPKLMFGMWGFFLLGGQGGLVFTLLEKRPFLESPHAISALAGIGLLTAQAVLGATMKGSPLARTGHAYLGSSLMAVFFVHAGLGLANGLSF